MLLFATTSPPYAEKLNAATIQAALDLPEASARSSSAAPRAWAGALLLGLDLARKPAGGRWSAPATSSSAPPAARARARAATGPPLSSPGSERDAVARVIGRASATIEILDVWRLPEDRFARQWEERFTADTMAPAIDRHARSARCEAGGIDAIDAPTA